MTIYTQSFTIGGHCFAYLLRKLWPSEVNAKWQEGKKVIFEYLIFEYLSQVPIWYFPEDLILNKWMISQQSLW
jgi:hypothetical protein